MSSYRGLLIYLSETLTVTAEPAVYGPHSYHTLLTLFSTVNVLQTDSVFYFSFFSCILCSCLDLQKIPHALPLVRQTPLAWTDPPWCLVCQTATISLSNYLIKNHYGNGFALEMSQLGEGWGGPDRKLNSSPHAPSLRERQAYFPHTLFQIYNAYQKTLAVTEWVG